MAAARAFVMHVHPLQEVVAHRLRGLQAQAVDVGGRVVAGQGGQVDARHRPEEPGGLRQQRGRWVKIFFSPKMSAVEPRSDLTVGFEPPTFWVPVENISH